MAEAGDSTTSVGISSIGNHPSTPENSHSLDMIADNEEIKKMFECPVCYEIILPPITLCMGGHAVCNSCKNNLESCPSCRAPFTEIRNRFAEDFLERCTVVCKYRDAGCNVKLTGRDLSRHLRDCTFRPLLCRECDKEIPYHQFLKHLKEEEKLETQKATECSTGFEIEEELFRTEGGDRFNVWEPTWINAFGHDFFCFLETINSHWWIWVGGYATPEVCEKFTCSITVWNKETKTEKKYVGKVHPIRTPTDEVLSSGLCLTFMDINLKNLMYKGGIDVHVRIDTEYVPPKTRKGTLVESPLAVFGDTFGAAKGESARANRINRGSTSSRSANTNITSVPPSPSQTRTIDDDISEI